jgi:uncharacterized protein YkwD
MKKIIALISIVVLIAGGYRLLSGQPKKEISIATLSLVRLNNKIDSLFNNLFHLKKDIQALPQTVNQQSQNVEPIPEILTTDAPNTINRQTILAAINHERISRGLHGLKLVTKLNNSAIEKNNDMIANQYFAHDSPVDKAKDFSYFISAQRYEFVRISENLAMGDFITASEVVDAWMKSPGHRSNILFPGYQETGISVKTGTMDGKRVTLIVQHFGIPRSACPTISDAVIQTMQNLEQKAGESRKEADSLRDQVHTAEKQTNIDPSTFDKLIEKYNNTIRVYNQFVIEFQAITDEYERQIKSYDLCVEKLN